MLSYQDLLAQSKALEAKVKRARKAELAEMLPKIKAMMKEFQIQPEDLRFVTVQNKPTAANARYRSPDGQTWAGRGRKPKWVQDILAAGGNIEDYALAQDQSKTAS